MPRLLLVTFLLAACVAPTPPTVVISLPPAHTLTLTRPYPDTPTSTLAPTPTDTPTPEPTATPTPLTSKVVIISIDGLRPDALLQANAPNLLGLAQRGAYSWTAQTIFPPVTLPSHASMMSGYLPLQHGMDWNDYFPAKGFITVPTIFSLAHEAGLRTVLIAGKEKFQHYNAPGALDSYVFAILGDPSVAEAALVEIEKGFGLLFIHLPNIDYFGHSTGWMSPTQIFETSRTDEQVGRILAALPAETLIIVSADHGGHGNGHGANIPEDMTIPWIIAGPNVIADHALTTPVTTLDTAATALFALGLPIPQDAIGQPVYEAFGLNPPDLIAGTWRDGATQSPARSEMPAVVLNDLIYVPGGFGGESTMQAYDPIVDSWINLAPLPSGRHHLMAAASDGKVYLFGGAAANGWDATDTVFVYDPASDQWIQLPAMPEPRLSGAAVALNGKLYVVGGVGGTQALLEFDPASGEWRTLAALGQPREHFSVVAYGGEIYVLGGRWGGVGELISVEIYNPAKNEWRPGPDLL
ncbi:MAG TPA: alkaline phosphatase family protein, partial [Anaerolineales bacterium]|nr:alkaline phosphatase family protein [Anaerolineales bacterium]